VSDKVKEQLRTITLIILVVTIVTLLTAFLRGATSTAGNSVKKIDPTLSEPQVLYFWATWCGICESQRPMLQTSLSWLTVDSKFLSIEEGSNTQEELSAFLQKNPIHGKTVTGSHEFLTSWKISAFPTTIFLSDSGEVVFKETGLLTPPGFVLRYYLARLL
jgi:thiol-disulfide isomerase/thioredoxin